LRDTCTPRYAPAFGTSLASCTCSDGTRLDLCSTADCATTGATDICFGACISHGGATATDCKADADACTGAILPPPGNVDFECFCGDNTEIDLCTSYSCDTWEFQDSVCDPACALHGGFGGFGCMGMQDPCVDQYRPPFGPNGLACTCMDKAVM